MESLKYIWHSLDVPPAKEEDNRALLALVERGARGPVDRMRRNLIGEAVTILVAYIPVAVLFLLEFDGRLAAISWLFIGVAAFFLAYYYRKYRLLSKMQCPACEVRSNLVRQVAILKRYTRFYVIAGTAMIPITWLFAYGIVRWRLAADVAELYRRAHPVPWWASPVFWLIMLIPLTVGIYFANAWYVDRLYGRHIKKLHDLLLEMEAE
ncbi:MAG TPA: hypothetical protein VN616_06815 [Puia sp.]|nr:hypothetical protein [Puia sp.]